MRGGGAAMFGDGGWLGFVIAGCGGGEGRLRRRGWGLFGIDVAEVEEAGKNV